MTSSASGSTIASLGTGTPEAPAPVLPPLPLMPGLAYATPPLPQPNVERLATNAALFLEQGSKALAAYLKPLETGTAKKSDMSDNVTAAVTAIGRVAEYWMTDPTRVTAAQAAIATPFMQLWSQTYRRLQGETVAPVVPVAKGDRRFAAAD